MKPTLVEIIQYSSNISSICEQTMKIVVHSKQYCEHTAKQCQTNIKQQENLGKQANKKNKYAYQLAIE